MNDSYLQLKKLITTHYKNLVINPNQEIALQPLNIFIGANGSGKTNLINVLKFFKDCVRPIDGFQGVTAYQQAVINQLGGSKLLDGHLSYPANATYLFEFTDNQTRSPIWFEVTLHAKDAMTIPFIIEESFYFHQIEPFYYYRCHHQQTGIGIVSIDNPNETQKETHVEEITGVPTNELTLLAIPKLLEGSHFAPEKAPVYKARRQLLETVQQWHFYNANDMSLKAIRDAYPKIGANDIYLSATGENLPLVLDNLMQHPTYGLDFEEQINNAMKSILPNTRKIKTYRSNLSLAVQWHFEQMREPFYLSELSDGSVRMLCWATLLHSPILPTLLVIDEPELGLHVAWMQILAEWIKNAAHKTQVIITTHSPDLLDYFTDSVENVLRFERQDQTHFTIKPLSASVLSSKIEEGWQLGDLYRIA